METIPLSALQHYAFCPRQCALIHNEQLWAANFLTTQGDLLHERVDAGEPETRKGVRFERSVHVYSLKLGIGGILDLLEIETASGIMRPVEYKRGKHFAWRKCAIPPLQKALYGMDKPGIAKSCHSMRHYVQKLKRLLLKCVNYWNQE